MQLAGEGVKGRDAKDVRREERRKGSRNECGKRQKRKEGSQGRGIISFRTEGWGEAMSPTVWPVGGF